MKLFFSILTIFAAASVTTFAANAGSPRESDVKFDFAGVRVGDFADFAITKLKKEGYRFDEAVFVDCAQKNVSGIWITPCTVGPNISLNKSDADGQMTVTLKTTEAGDSRQDYALSEAVVWKISGRVEFLDLNAATPPRYREILKAKYPSLNELGEYTDFQNLGLCDERPDVSQRNYSYSQSMGYTNWGQQNEGACRGIYAYIAASDGFSDHPTLYVDIFDKDLLRRVNDVVEGVMVEHAKKDAVKSRAPRF